MISRNVRIQKAYIFHKIVAFLLDILNYILLILVLYFSTLYLIFEPTLKYSDAKSSSYEIRETYGLSLGDNKSYEELLEEIKPRLEFTILNCGYNCKYALDKLPIKRNKAILENIISLGMMDKYEKIINNCNCKKSKH